MSGFDAILFDFDGVLVDSEPVHCASWREALAPLGVTLAWEDFRRHYIGMDDRLMVERLAEAAGRDWRPLWERYPVKKELFRARMLEAPPFAEGLGRLLDGLRGAYRLAIVSCSSRTEIDPVVERAGLRAYFDAIIGREDVARPKPAPDAYLLAANRLGARSPLVLEDSEPGVAAARAAGFSVLKIAGPGELERALRSHLIVKEQGCKPGEVR